MNANANANANANTDYESVHVMPAQELASRVVSSLIMCKGNVNQWALTIKSLIVMLRVEPAAPLLLEVRLMYLLEEARMSGQVVTVELVPTVPLRMGGYNMRSEVRPSRANYAGPPPAREIPTGISAYRTNDGTTGSSYPPLQKD